MFRDLTLVPLDHSFQIDLGTDNWICCQATGRLKHGEFVLKGVKGYMSRGHCCFRPILCSVFTLTQNGSVDKFIKQFSFGNTGQNNFLG